MSVLLDHCMPKQSGRLLTGHEVQTTSAMGWLNLSNGKLLDAGAGQFDVLVTVDRNLQFQQHTGALPMAVFTLGAVSNRLRDPAPFVPEALRLLSSDMQKRVYVLERQ